MQPENTKRTRLL